MTTPDLLRVLYDAGVEVRLEGDLVRLVPGPDGVPAALRGPLRQLESEVLSLLRWESWLFSAPLFVFAQCGVMAEVRVPGIDQTIWFASGPDQMARLQAEGIPRGRIWSTEELQRLWDWAPGYEEVIRAAKLKLTYNATLDRVTPAAEAPAPKPAPEPAQGRLDLGADARELD